MMLQSYKIFAKCKQKRLFVFKLFVYKVIQQLVEIIIVNGIRAIFFLFLVTVCLHPFIFIILPPIYHFLAEFCQIPINCPFALVATFQELINQFCLFSKQGINFYHILHIVYQQQLQIARKIEAFCYIKQF